MLTHCGTQAIKTERLILRRFTQDDYVDVFEYWASDPDVQLMYAEPVYQTLTEVTELLAGFIESYEKEDYYRWAIIEKDSEICIGQIAFFLVDSRNHFGEIEYCIGKKFQRQGYATEVTRAILSYGFEKINFHKVQIGHKEFNIASKGVIQKCGFTFEGKLRDFFFIDGVYVSRLYYSMLENEWRERYIQKTL